MPLNKKIILLICVSVIFFNAFSGCILEDLFGGTRFNLESYSVTDAEGFPVLSLFFSISNKVTLKMYKGSSLIDSEYFYSDTNTTLNIGDFQETPIPGSYVLEVYDKNLNEIHEERFTFNGPDLNILSCEQEWWKNGNEYSLIGLKLDILNNGDVPVYPYSITLETDSETLDGIILPTALLPSSSSDVYCYLYHEGIFNSNDFTITLKDKNDNILVSDSFNFNVINTVSTRHYTDGLDSTLSIPYPGFLHDYYRSLDRIYVDDYSLFVFDEYDDAYIDLVVKSIISTMNFGEYRFNVISDVKKIEYIASLVQNLDYKLDSQVNDSFEYPRYPIETFFNGDEGGGDCEDKAILTASLLKNLGYEIALLRLPEHMALGVKLSEDALPGAEYYVDDYYYFETTAPGHKCGDIPKDRESPAELSAYPVGDRPFIYHIWRNDVITIYKNTEQGDIVKSVCMISNLGNETANNITLKGVFVTEHDLELSAATTTIDSIEPGDKKKIVITAIIPGTFTTWFETQVYRDGEIVDTERSKNTFS